MSDGAWIFLSHSHKDFDRVRALRNELEVLQHHPLIFFLKCLDDSSEIDGLIRREIEARSWFILCDSENSRASNWVQQERQIIAGLPTHTSATVDLADSLQTQMASLSRLLKSATVFLSYTAPNADVARAISASLKADDFGVFFDREDLRGGDLWQARIASAIDDAADRGAVLLLLGRGSVTSHRQVREITLAMERAARRSHPAHIVPIYVEPPALFLEELPPALRDQLRRQAIDLSTGDRQAKLAQLKQRLRTFEW